VEVGGAVARLSATAVSGDRGRRKDRGMSRRRKITIIVLKGGIAALALILLYGPGWFIAWADDPGK
jgi:hypothetical protein